MRRPSLIVVWSVLASFFPSVVAGQSTPAGEPQPEEAPKHTILDAKLFDLDDNGLSATEERAWLRHMYSEWYRLADTNRDGTISTDERTIVEDLYGIKSAAKYERDVDDIPFFEPEDLKARRGGRSLLPISEANDVMVKAKIKPKPSPFIIRRSFEDVGILTEAKEFRKAAGALFSYSRDLEDDKDLWQARGAIIVPIELSGSAFLVPSVSFDRVTSNNDINSLVFRIGIEFEGTSQTFDSQYVRILGTYATDFDFDSSVIGLEFEWEPVKLTWSIGTSVRFPDQDGPIEFRFRPILHVEFGNTLDAGTKPNLQDDETWFRVGPKLKLDFWPTAPALKRLAGYVSWQHLEGIEGVPNGSDLFEVGATWQLDEVGHFQLEASYRNGETPLVLDDTNMLTIGLSIKF